MKPKLTRIEAVVLILIVLVVGWFSQAAVRNFWQTRTHKQAISQIDSLLLDAGLSTSAGWENTRRCELNNTQFGQELRAKDITADLSNIKTLLRQAQAHKLIVTSTKEGQDAPDVFSIQGKTWKMYATRQIDNVSYLLQFTIDASRIDPAYPNNSTFVCG